MKNWIPIAFLCVFLNSCSGDDRQLVYAPPIPTPTTSLRYLALGDSYTIGQNVCMPCRFPEQLKDSLQTSLERDFYLRIVAETGWTTSNLLHAINTQNLTNDYDLVTLLIGVNNQYIHRPFAEYEEQFPALLDSAIAFAKGDKNRVIVVSIPDYAFTPFGQGSSNPEMISTEIDQYNAFAQNYCETLGVAFVNITDITRNGLDNPALVASDGLHPSQMAYAQFVERLFPKAMAALSQ